MKTSPTRCMTSACWNSEGSTVPQTVCAYELCSGSALCVSLLHGLLLDYWSGVYWLLSPSHQRSPLSHPSFESRHKSSAWTKRGGAMLWTGGCWRRPWRSLGWVCLEEAAPAWRQSHCTAPRCRYSSRYIWNHSGLEPIKVREPTE